MDSILCRRADQHDERVHGDIGDGDDDARHARTCRRLASCVTRDLRGEEEAAARSLAMPSRRGHPPRPRQPLYSSKSASLLLPPLPPAPADSEPLEMRSAAMIAFDNRKLNQSILKQLEDERKLEKKLEHEMLRMMPLKQQLKK